MVSKADGIKGDEIAAESAAVASKASPPTFVRPIRRKGYYRALRAEKSWAIMQWAVETMASTINQMQSFYNSPTTVGLYDWLPKEPQK